MKHPGVLIAATKSGSGKTTITCALLQALKERGIRTRAFKCGPDYIDPMFHKQIIGVPSRNLDTFFSGPEQIRELYQMNSKETDDKAEISVIEGVMGLYDGLGGIREEGSAYHLAEVLDIPIVLVLDAHGMGRSMIPLLAGFLQYDKSHLIRGVILNRTTPMFLQTIAPLIEQELKLPVLGCFPKTQKLVLPGRHLGLVMPDEIDDIRRQLHEAAVQLEKTVDIDCILAIADEAGKKDDFSRKTADGDALQTSERTEDGQEKKNGIELENGGETCENLRLAVAQDEAFCFYYEDNLKLLRENGVTIVWFSPIHDEVLPQNIDGILFGGGYPELHAGALEANEKMRKAIRDSITAGMPSVAECGGFMYLHDTLVDKTGASFHMAGVLPAECKDTGKLVRFGYVEIEEKEADWLPAGTKIRGHEFHYYDSSDNGMDCVAQKPVTGRNWPCIHNAPEHWWGYPHLYYPSNPEFVYHFVAQMRKWKQETMK